MHCHSACVRCEVRYCVVSEMSGRGVRDRQGRNRGASIPSDKPYEGVHGPRETLGSLCACLTGDERYGAPGGP